MTEEVMEEVRAWQSRPLEPVYPIVYLDAVCEDAARGTSREPGGVCRHGRISANEVQLCIVHLMRASLDYVTWQDRKAVAAQLKPIYRAATEEQGREELEAFIGRWGAKYQAIGKLWREQWVRVMPFFVFAPEIRKVIYTTNAVESLHMSLRKIHPEPGFFSGRRERDQTAVSGVA